MFEKEKIIQFIRSTLNLPSIWFQDDIQKNNNRKFKKSTFEEKLTHTFIDYCVSNLMKRANNGGSRELLKGLENVI